MVVLRKSLNLRVVEAGLFHGVNLHDTVTLSHLFYADDAVFVGQWSQRNISTLTHVLKCFHKASGLKINMCKIILSMVGGRMHRLHSWDDMVDRVRNRLSKWKMKMLSSRGRLTLMKSVLGSMPIFHMSLFKVPAEKGGLGVSSLYALNRGLLFKWVWRFLTQWSSLWARVIQAIHGIDGSIGDTRSGNSKSCWSSIINEVNVLSSKGIKLMNYLRITLGNGVFTRLWDKPWHVEDKLAHQTLSHSFRRLPRGGIENTQFAEFSVLLQQVVLAQGSDRWTWTANGSGQFSVASVRKIIDNKLCSGGENSTRWIRCVPNKINIHAWKVMTGSLATRWWEVSDMEIDLYATWKGCEEHQNERTPSPSPRGKSLSPPHAPSKSTSSRSTYQTTSSSLSKSLTPTHVAPLPKLRFVLLMNLKPQELHLYQTPPHDTHVSAVDHNWPPGPSNPLPPPPVSPPPFLNPPPRFKHPHPPPLWFVDINNNAPQLENHQNLPQNLGN
nr:RNA-directed DNA polymerase, eukaryota, reverse transcriptase zinc-binding domain protein [Tanacetum cinerariifolium]